MRFVSVEDELRYRLNELIVCLTDEDIAQLRSLDLAAAWPPEISSTRRVERVLSLLEEAARAEIDEHQLASGTSASLRAQVLAHIFPDAAQDAATNGPAIILRRFRVILLSSDARVISGYYGHHADQLPKVGDTIDVRERSDETRIIRARVTQVTRENNLPIEATILDA